MQVPLDASDCTSLKYVVQAKLPPIKPLAIQQCVNTDTTARIAFVFTTTADARAYLSQVWGGAMGAVRGGTVVTGGGDMACQVCTWMRGFSTTADARAYSTQVGGGRDR